MVKSGAISPRRNQRGQGNERNNKDTDGNVYRPSIDPDRIPFQQGLPEGGGRLEGGGLQMGGRGKG